MRRILSYILLTAAAVISAAVSGSCLKDPQPEPEPDTFDNVLVMYSAGYNSLSGDLEDDINDVRNSGFLPSKGSRNALLVFSKRTKSSYDYSTRTPAYLIRLYSDSNGKAAADTVKTFNDSPIASSASTMSEVLSLVKSLYPANGYGMIFSSHSSGWLPAGYYTSGKITTSSKSRKMAHGLFSSAPAPVLVPYVEPEYAPGEPRVRSIGMDNASGDTAYEMELEDFVAAIPMHLDYLIFDTCLMGGVEVAYALRETCAKVIFSVTEIMADGLCDYTKAADRLLGGSSPDLKGLCEDSFAHYLEKSGLYRSLTISMVDCAKTERLAAECKSLFFGYRSKIAAINPSAVQPFFRGSKHWFYDLRDILVQSGIPAADLAGFDSAMDDCIDYCEATEKFIDITIRTHCGLSMYLPANGSAELDDFYKTLSWNKATGLVE